MLAFKLSVLEIIIIEQSWVGRGGCGGVAFKGRLGRVVLTRTSNPEPVSDKSRIIFGDPDSFHLTRIQN